MPRRRPRIRLPLLLAVAATLLLVAAYIFGLAHYQAHGSSLFTPSDLYVPRSIDVIVIAWCFWIGSSIGSFLNVVAWRMPRGETINGRSHCPRCMAQLKARDNFPVFGWLALGGRCRSCHLPISPRYPIVEGVVGLTLTAVAVAELYRLSLPRQFVHWHGGPFWAPVIDHDVLLVLLYHVVAITMSWAFGLIRFDNHPLPRRLVAFAFGAAVIPILVYPTAMVVPWQFAVGEDWRPNGLYMDSLLRVITALAAATILARYLARGLCPAADPKLDPLGRSTAKLIDLISILAIPIFVVGWQVAPAVTVLASLIALSLRRILPASSSSLGRFAIAMPLATALQIVFWRRLHAESDDGIGAIGVWPSDGGSPWVFLAWTAAVLCVPLWLREQNVGQDPESDEEIPLGEMSRDELGPTDDDDLVDEHDPSEADDFPRGG